MANHKLAFSSNWNNKLNCYSFTSFRLQGTKYQRGTLFDVYLNDKFLGVAICNYAEQMGLSAINPRISFLDTGYSPDTMRGIIRQMYKNSTLDVETTAFALCTFSWMGEPPTIDNVPKRKKAQNHPLAVAQG